MKKKTLKRRRRKYFNERVRVVSNGERERERERVRKEVEKYEKLSEYRYLENKRRGERRQRGEERLKVGKSDNGEVIT